MSSTRPIFASKIAYDALAIESGEETEEEELLEEQSSDIHDAPAKPTKSAIKRANRLARLEQKQRQKEAKAQAQKAEQHAPQPSVSAPATAAPSLAAPTVKAEPSPAKKKPFVSQPVVLEPPVPAVSAPLSISAPKPEKTPVPNGTAPKRQPLSAASESSAKVASILSKPSTGPSVEPAPLVVEPKKAAAPEAALAVQTAPQDAEKVKKRQSFVTRTLWTFIMIGGFIALLLLGHTYMILLVMLCQTLVYREVTALFSLKSATPESGETHAPKGKDPWSKTLNWYFFAVTNYFLYGESIIYYFKHVVFADAQLLPFATNHRMISFMLYIIGFMGFVMSLKKGYLKQQFGLFCWVHMSLLLIVLSSHFIMNNILEGLIWFWVPASLVICNDVFAYIWGITVGRTPLIKLSPKKTVEGFVGAFLTTLVFAVGWGTFFMRYNYMICPVHDLGVSAWSSIQCTPNPVFVWRSVQLWSPVATVLSTLFRSSITKISYAPYQLHLLVLACFASLVAPFGGFFASGFKRAFNIKDFGHSIPGHGGMTDRMDCQFLMGVFTYVYYSSLIREHHVTVGSILQTIVSGLTIDEQLELVSDLTRYLQKQGIVVPHN
ncbi:cytidylyltransferase family-domain-containing protein [Crucibulum laeve]|uniref:Phosphatidate cytidylyltransferase n=1 Tax=Crucibulum laeve TaxID=68775 RepID=A0A5C3MJ64_9AGAR|nr:cytidylyltransferase family-domain-containing protein [Crucibulum laeve]